MRTKRKEIEQELADGFKEIGERYAEKMGTMSYFSLLNAYKREILSLAITMCKGNIQLASSVVGIKRSTLTLMLQKFKLFELVQRLREHGQTKTIVYKRDPSAGKKGSKKHRRCRSCKTISYIFASDSCPKCKSPRQYIRRISQTERKAHGL